ncbi:hypothetical protein SSX86_028058 [Deinandra increscens subsp. villosa]|uniref:PGG domain-containing protein n=1 Tax=Deinandra increscens subsp. villosa TaxID=3103831 RepID=A0AAP0C786_9ASTR
METKLYEASLTNEVEAQHQLSPIPEPLTRPSPHRPKGFVSGTWARYVNADHNWIEKQRGILILAALVVAGVSFHSGINPPGGTITNTENGRYSLGNAVQTEVDMDSFNQFVAFNSLTMVTSLAIVVLLVSGVPLRNKFWMWALTVGAMFAMVCMVATYLRSLSMMAPDGYVDGASVWICLIWMLGCGVIGLIHTILFLVWVVMKLSKWRMPVRKGNHDVVEV